MVAMLPDGDIAMTFAHSFPPKNKSGLSARDDLHVPEVPPGALTAYCLNARDKKQLLTSRHWSCSKVLIVFPIGYIGEFEEVDDHRSGKIVIQLNGR